MSNTQVVFDPSPKQQEFIDAARSGNYKFMLYAGSIRSGKTFASHAILLMLASAFPETKYAIIRTTLAALKNTSIVSFFKLCPEYFIKNYNQDTQTVTFINGSTLVFFSENYDEDKQLIRFQGVEWNAVVVDEIDGIQEATFERLKQRVGSWIPLGKPYPRPLIIGNCPPNNTWVSKIWYEPFAAGTLEAPYYFLQASILDNKFITNNLEYMEGLKSLSRFNYQVQVEGRWQLDEKTPGSFHKSFDIDLHTGPTSYDPAEPLHISFDENVNPYVPLGIFQIITNGPNCKRFTMINEITGKYPDNKLNWVCEEFARLYPDHKAGLFIYGDRTSIKEDSKLEKGQNFFNLAMNYLQAYKPKLRLPSANPSVVLAGSYIDTVFEMKRKGISIMIGEKCTHTVRDFQNLKQDSDGKKLKKVVRDPKSGVTYQQYGHFSDAFTYCFIEAFMDDFLYFQRGDRELIRTFGRNECKNTYGYQGKRSYPKNSY